MAEADWKYLQYNIETGQKRTGDGPSGGASSLSDLDDTSISNPSDGQILGYDGTAGKWKNVAAPAGQVTDVKLDNQSVVDQNGVAQLTTPNIDGLGKTDISNPANGEMLGYDGTEGKWKNVPAPGGNVDDVKVNGTSVVSNKVANITSYKEVTQAQYEALPDTKLSDNVLYAIKDGGQAVDGFPPLIYSFDEREIGVWIDGRPLYQKVITFSSVENSPAKRWYNLADVSSLSINNLVTCVLYNGNYEAWYEYYSAVRDGYLKIYSANDSWGANAALIQYTKTTDTPGSGIWNQQGALAHHYSTDEKIIGTWIDGKPIYEKVLEFSSAKIFSTNSWVTVDDSTNIDRCIDATAFHSDGTMYKYIALDPTRDNHTHLGLKSANDGSCVKLMYQYTKTTD